MRYSSRFWLYAPLAAFALLILGIMVHWWFAAAAFEKRLAAIKGREAAPGITLKAVATALEIPLKAGVVKAEGDLDFRGTLGVAKDAPVGFREIRLSFDLDTDAPQDKIDSLIKLTERYCVIFQTLNKPPKLTLNVARS